MTGSPADFEDTMCQKSAECYNHTHTRARYHTYTPQVGQNKFCQFHPETVDFWLAVEVTVTLGTLALEKKHVPPVETMKVDQAGRSAVIKIATD